MGWNTTVVCAAIVAIGSAVLWLMERRDRREAERRKAEKRAEFLRGEKDDD